ncbi:unnamed protein product [Psylliodes chrysocephalus]|uniref:Uncharacterized protein n=1 Tax=Psylliodes chrysocephalus TaxID=3402493 RepID=A0A9P0D803_9CUCU|nr:unnamed protein product [Psylliodes chrysocephala]
MPPIVIDGKTKDQTTLIKDLKEHVKGEFSIKHTNATTIIFVDDKEDHTRVINNIRAEKLAYHTYTSSDDKSHAFVLRGLVQGTKIVDIETNLEEEHEIKYQSQTSEEDTLTVRERFNRDDKMPHSPNSLFEFRSEKQREDYKRERDQKKAEEEISKKNDEQFTVPRKFSSNFHRMIREKAVQTLTTTRNSYQVLTDESDSENDDEIEGKEDYEKVLNNVKSEKMAYHTYTAYSEKSHAFVLRGLAENTKIQDIKENLEDDHEIVAREIYTMKTKERPLYLVVTDPVITLEYLNKNIRRVLHTRVTWELRKSVKQIIQCHTCQEWGHATANCEYSKPENLPPIVKKTLPLPSNVVARLLDFQTNDFSGNLPPFTPYNPTAGFESGQKGDELSSSSTGHISNPPGMSAKRGEYHLSRDPRKPPSPRLRAYSDPRARKNKDDHNNVLKNMKDEKMSFHTYTHRDDKSHAFVLRGLAEGTKITLKKTSRRSTTLSQGLFTK